MGFLAVLLSMIGCDRTRELQAGKSTAAEVRQKMGEPAMVWREGGGEVWEYPFTPQGTRNYMITIGADGIVAGIDQVLTEQNFARVRAGMRRDEIRRLLGKPASMQVFAGRGEEVWDWKMATPFPAETRFNVHFDRNGVVTMTSKTEDSR